MLNIDYAELCNKWVVMDTHPELTRKPKNKKILNAIYIAGDMMGVNHKGLADYLKRLAPRKSKTDGEKVAFFDNSYKYVGENLTITSPGRFLKKVIPGVDDKLSEAFAIFWQDNVTFDASDFVVHVGDTKEDFVNSFTKYRTTRSLDVGSGVKSISDSCMRHSFDRLGNHPSEAYASGDFFVVSVKDKEGKTRARTIVSNKTRNKFGEVSSQNKAYNHIYAADNHSVSLIREKLKDLGAVFIGSNYFSNWDYLRILAIRSSDYPWDDYNKVYIAPYVDGVRCYLLGEGGYNGDYLHIIKEYTADCEDKICRFSDTSGTVNMAVDNQKRLTIPGLSKS